MDNSVRKNIFVDLPNFYSRLINSSMGEPRFLRDYFLYWLDFDLLSFILTGDISSTWVFYSGRRFGPSDNRISGSYLDDYVKRINSLPGVTARDVNIPGEQREPASYQCEKCNHEGIAQWESEKGIDSSLTVYLFDTLDAWDVAYLLSGDADFVPAVSSLRRRGKIIIGAGFSDASTALVRECFSFIDLSQSFMVDDIIAYRLFKPDGIIHNWLEKPVLSGPSKQKVSVEWGLSKVYSFEGSEETKFIVTLNAGKGENIESHLSLLDEVYSLSPESIQKLGSDGTASKSYSIRLNPTVMRRLEDKTDIVKNAKSIFPSSYGGMMKGYHQNYVFNSQLNKFEVEKS